MFKRYSQLAEGMVQIDMTHSNIPTKHVDLRLDLHTKISEVKEKFRTHIGTPVDHQRLILKDNGRVICEMADNNRMLGYYSVSSGMEIHIIDTDPFSLSRGGGLTDVSLVQVYPLACLLAHSCFLVVLLLFYFCYIVVFILHSTLR